MSFRRLSFLVALIVLSIGSTAAVSEPLLHRHQHPGRALFQSQAQASGSQRRQSQAKGKLLEQLNLSEDQKQQLVSIRQKYKDQISQKMQSLRTLQQELRTMMAGETSATDIRAKHTEVAKLDQELSNLRFESMLEMREVLTPEQRSQFAQIMKQRREGSRRRTNLENPQSGQEKGNRNKRNNPQLEPEKENGKNIAI